MNDEPVRDYHLRRGDQIKIGDTILKYLSGSDVEAQYHEVIYKMTIVDGLTQVHNKRYLHETLEREIPRGRRHGRPLSVLMFDIDHFKKINDGYGHLAGDYVLKEMATLVKSRLRPDDVFGRYGGEEFCALLPETPISGAGAIAEDLRIAVQAHLFVFENETIPVTVSAGVANLQQDEDAPGLLNRAHEALLLSKRRGRNCTSLASGEPTQVRRWLDETALFRRALATATLDEIVAFELANESALLAERGKEGWESEVRRLESLVEEVAGAEDLLGRWNNRYVLVACSSADQLAREVRERWAEAHAGDGLDGAGLRTATSVRAEWEELGEPVLEQLIARLLRPASAPAAGGLAPALPFPLVGPELLVGTGTSALTRLKGLAHAIEVHLRFAAAVSLALLEPEKASATLLQLLAEARHRPLSMGKWRDLARAGAECVPAESNHPAAAWLRGLLGVRKKRARAPLGALEQIVNRRNALIGHRAPIADEAYAEAEPEFREALLELNEAAGPLVMTSLVSVVRTEILEDDGGFLYELRVHDGPSELFPVQRRELPHRMMNGAAYLLAGDRPPLALAPLVFSVTCTHCRRVELMLADVIRFGPKDALVKASGVTSDHVCETAVGASARHKAYLQALEMLEKTRLTEPPEPSPARYPSE